MFPHLATFLHEYIRGIRDILQLCPHPDQDQDRFQMVGEPPCLVFGLTFIRKKRKHIIKDSKRKMCLR